MQRKTRNLLLTAVAFVAALAIWLGLRGNRTIPILPEKTVMPAVPPSSSNAVTGQLKAPGIADKLHSISTSLSSTQTIADGRRKLTDLKRLLSASSTNEISAEIRKFLDSKVDASTGDGFRINSNHFL